MSSLARRIQRQIEKRQTAAQKQKFSQEARKRRSGRGKTKSQKEAERQKEIQAALKRGARNVLISQLKKSGINPDSVSIIEKDGSFTAIRKRQFVRNGRTLNLIEEIKATSRGIRTIKKKTVQTKKTKPKRFTRDDLLIERLKRRVTKPETAITLATPKKRSVTRISTVSVQKFRLPAPYKKSFVSLPVAERKKRVLIVEKLKNIPNSLKQKILASKKFNKSLEGLTFEEQLILQQERNRNILKGFGIVLVGTTISAAKGVKRGVVGLGRVPKLLTLLPKGLSAVGRGTRSLAVQSVTNPRVAFTRVKKGLTKAGIVTVNFAIDESNSLILDPAGTVAEYITFSAGLGFIGKVAKNSAVGQAISRNLFANSQATKIWKNLSKVQQKKLLAKGINANTLERQLKTILKANAVQKGLNPVTKGITFGQIKRAKPKTLTKQEWEALLRALQKGKSDTVIFGSVASKVQGGKKALSPKDIDLATNSIKQFNDDFLKQLPKSIRKNYILKGEKVFRKEGTRLIELFDLKPISRLKPARDIITRQAELPITKLTKSFKIVKSKGKGSVLPKIKQTKALKTVTIADSAKTEPFKKFEGIKMTGFSEQTTRKGLGTLQVLIEKNARRAKDPQSFIIQLQIQLDALKKSTVKSKIAKAINKKRIKELEDALKILNSKQFQNTLNTLVKETKEFKLINKKALTKAKKVSSKKLKDIKRNLKGKKPTLSNIKVASSILPSKLTRSVLKSRVPSKLKISKIPSKIPSKTTSKVPSKTPSKIKSRIRTTKPSLIKSKTKSVIKSRIPSRTPSKIPSKTPSKTPSRTPSKIPSKTPSKIPKKSKKKIRIPTLNWDKKPPTGTQYIVNVIVRIKGRNKEIPLKTTPNRALKKVASLIDKTTSRSFQLKIVGTRKTKDIAKPTLNKFRLKKSKGSPVLRVVEKSKFAIDTTGEKRGLKISKLLKPKKKSRTKKK